MAARRSALCSAMPDTSAIRGRNKICSKSYAKVEQTMNVMLLVGFFLEAARV